MKRGRAGSIVVATLMRPQGETGVQTHFNTFIRFLRGQQVPARCVTPFSASRALVYPLFSVRRVLDPASGAASVWWYRKWHRLVLRHALAGVLSREEGPSVVYAQCPLSAHAALSARRCAEQRVVMVAHFNGSQADEWADKGLIRRGGNLYRQISHFEERTLSQLDGIVYVSEYMRARLEHRVPSLRECRSAVIPNFLDPPPDPPAVSARNRDLVTVGTLEPRKNQRYLLEILGATRLLGRRYNVTLIGDGPDRASLEEIARQLGIREDAQFLGYRADAARLITEHRLYCHTATMENFGFAILEAMAGATPVIACPVGGTLEVFRPNVDGLLWPLGAPDVAARTLIACMDDGERLERMGISGRKRALARFSTQALAPRLLEFLYETHKAVR